MFTKVEAGCLYCIQLSNSLQSVFLFTLYTASHLFWNWVCNGHILFSPSSAVVSWVCGWTPSCTEAPPPSAPPSTTSHSPPSRTSTSTVWKSGPLSSLTCFSYFYIRSPLQTFKHPQVYYAPLGGNSSDPTTTLHVL